MVRNAVSRLAPCKAGFGSPAVVSSGGFGAAATQGGGFGGMASQGGGFGAAAAQSSGFAAFGNQGSAFGQTGKSFCFSNHKQPNKPKPRNPTRKPYRQNDVHLRWLDNDLMLTSPQTGTSIESHHV